MGLLDEIRKAQNLKNEIFTSALTSDERKKKFEELDKQKETIESLLESSEENLCKFCSRQIKNGNRVIKGKTEIEYKCAFLNSSLYNTKVLNCNHFKIANIN